METYFIEYDRVILKVVASTKCKVLIFFIVR